MEVADINPDRETAGGTGKLTVFDGAVYFAADDGTTGWELWKTDGTNTVQVADIRPGNESSRPDYMTVFNNELYFAAADADDYWNLWRTDGAAVVPVADVALGGPDDAIEFRGELYFRGNDRVTGSEPWKTDGTNTLQLGDIRPGRRSSTPLGFTALKDAVYFAAFEIDTGTELWKTDGSSVVQVADMNRGWASFIPGGGGNLTLTLFDDELYFAADDGSTGIELWKTDGTNIFQLADINPAGDGLSDTWPEMIELHGQLYFVGNDGTTGWELWKLTPIPEPSCLVLAAIGVALLVVYAWQRA